MQRARVEFQEWVRRGTIYDIAILAKFPPILYLPSWPLMAPDCTHLALHYWIAGSMSQPPVQSRVEQCGSEMTSNDLRLAAAAAVLLVLVLATTGGYGEARRGRGRVSMTHNIVIIAIINIGIGIMI